MKTFFFTGATGFIGQFLASALLEAGHRLIFLARGKDGATAEERVSKALSLVDVDAYIAHRGDYKVVDGDLDNLPTNISADAVFHAAGETSFAEKDRKKTMETNVLGVQKMLAFANKMGIREFHFVGAAYAHDFTSSGIVGESSPCGDQESFVNPYAESKCMGEISVREWGERSGNRAFIYAPSIVVGDGRTGITTSFTGYYRFMQAFSLLKNVVARKNGGDFNISIHVPGVKGATINIVTIDYVVDIVAKLIEKDVPGLYHITNGHAPEFEYLLQEGLKVIGVAGPSTANDPAQTRIIHRPIQAMVARGLKDYKPFISYATQFSQEETKRVLGDEFVEHPPVDSRMVQTLLGFALENDFSRERVYTTAHLRAVEDSQDWVRNFFPAAVG